MHPYEKKDGDWRLTNEKDQIILKFLVGNTTNEKNLEVATTDDQTLLVIRYKKEEDESSSQASSPDLDVRLLMPPDYDSNKIRATKEPDGWLQIVIPKPKHERKMIPVSPVSSSSG